MVSVVLLGSQVFSSRSPPTRILLKPMKLLKAGFTLALHLMSTGLKYQRCSA